ncbi:methylglyoxal synthase [Bacteroidota bacterium]
MKTIALVAHDNRKQDLIEWVIFNKDKLSKYRLICTGTTGKLIQQVFSNAKDDDEIPEVILLKSGPLGGDQQLGAKISDGEIDILIFLWDPMQPQPHDVDVKALLRISVLYNIPIANNRATADFLISSPLFDEKYKPVIKDYSKYLERELNINK